MSPVQLIFVAPTPILAGYVADRFGNYDLAFIGIFIILGFGVVCAALAAPPKKPQQE